jgi:hypothetical protein
MPEHNPGAMGGKFYRTTNEKFLFLFYFIGTMRLGRRTTYFVTDDSLVSTYDV